MRLSVDFAVDTKFLLDCANEFVWLGEQLNNNLLVRRASELANRLRTVLHLQRALPNKLAAVQVFATLRVQHFNEACRVSKSDQLSLMEPHYYDQLRHAARYVYVQCAMRLQAEYPQAFAPMSTVNY